VQARSTSATEPGSYGSAQNRSAAPSSSAWAADWKSVAGNSRGCCYRTAYHVACAAAARTSVHRWESLGGCCYSLASRAERTGRSRLQIARLRVPTADDWFGCHGPIAPENSLTGSSFQTQLADGPGHSYFLGLPRCVSYCPCAANHCCPPHRRDCGSSCSSRMAAGYSIVPAAGNSSRMTAMCCPDGRSWPARCDLAHCRCAPESDPRY
jgi:hypothetical protein